MKELLEKLIARQPLSVGESSELMHTLLTDSIEDSVIAAILTSLRMRGVTVDELDGFSRAVQELCVPLDLGSHRLLDVCGTGGDGKSSFNISTTVAFVLAGAGYKVAKHGNYAVSSSCGSSNVLEALGVKFATDRDTALKALDTSGVCFLHAPHFHPVLKRVAPVRKSLGVRTIFNVLGPLVNPARPEFQCTGVYDLELMRLYSYLLGRRANRFAVVHSLDGYDEVSLTGAVRVAHRNGVADLLPKDFGFSPIQQDEIASGRTVQESAAIVRQVLSGDATPAQQGVVVANAALAMWKFEEQGNLSDWVSTATESIRSGRAYEALTQSL